MKKELFRQFLFPLTTNRLVFGFEGAEAAPPISEAEQAELDGLTGKINDMERGDIDRAISGTIANPIVVRAKELLMKKDAAGLIPDSGDYEEWTPERSALNRIIGAEKLAMYNRMQQSTDDAAGDPDLFLRPKILF